MQRGRKKTRRKDTSIDRVTEYARSVVAGEIIAGPHVRAQCSRHLSDLDEQEKRGIIWDIKRAQKALDFFPEVLCLNGGEYEGAPYHLLGWQAFVVGSIFGWLRADTGYRRFRTIYVETGKGSGKSPLAAGIGLKGLVSDGEPRAEIYSAAVKKDQAQILFRDAVAMVDQSRLLTERLTKSGVGEKTWNLAYLDKGSFFRPIASDDGQSGPRPHVALIDEIHEHRTNRVIEMIRAGTKSRRQALIVMITNSGSDRLGPCWAYHQYGIEVANGTRDDDSFFPYICALDEHDDPFASEDCWPKANPSLQEANLPGYQYIREQVREARGMPSKESIVRRLNFCQWTEASNPWVSLEVWKDARRDYDIEQLRGRRAWAGLDLSSTTDLTGLVFLVEPMEECEPWKILPYAWLPSDGLAEKSARDIRSDAYVRWVQSGHLLTTPGRAISKRDVLQKLSQMCGVLEVVACAYDRWRIQDLLQLASDDGIILPDMIPFGQGYQSMSPALETFETLLLGGQLAHNGHPVLNMCFANAVTSTDAAGNRKLDKERATGRIDLAVAAVMASGVLSTRQQPAPKYQVLFV